MDNDGAGLLLARAYAISDHKRLVLAVLGILGCCAIVPLLVCSHIYCLKRRRDRYPPQPIAVLNGCDINSSRSGTVAMWVESAAIFHFTWNSPKYLLNSSDVRRVELTFIFIIDLPCSVNDLISIATILFDTIVVSVTLASTLGSWRFYERSTWLGSSLVNLLIQQSKW